MYYKWGNGGKKTSNTHSLYEVHVFFNSTRTRHNYLRLKYFWSFVVCIPSIYDTSVVESFFFLNENIELSPGNCQETQQIHAQCVSFRKKQTEI